MHSGTEVRTRTSRGPSFSSWPSDSRLLVGAMTLWGALLRLLFLGRKSFWLDEIASVSISLHPGALFWHWVWHHEGNMALYYVLLKPWLHFGLNEATVRLLSVIPGVLTIPVIYALGKRLFSSRVGLIAAGLMMVSPCDVVYSQEARGYSLLVLAVSVSTLLFVRLVEEPGLAAACAYGIAAALTLYCHYFGLLAVAAQLASLIALPEGRAPWRQLSVAVALIVVFGAPVVWMIHSQDSAHIAWVAKPSLLELYHLGAFLAAESGKLLGGLLLACELPLIAIFLLTMTRVPRGTGSFEFWHYALITSCLFTPIALSLIASMVKPVFFHRFLIICLPAWLMTVAAGMATIASRRRRAVALTIVCGLSLACIGESYFRVREDWRGVAQFLITHASRQDQVLYYHPVGYFAAESYRDWLPGGNVNRPIGVQVPDNNGNWTPTGRSERIWLVHYPANLRDGKLQALESQLAAEYTPETNTDFHAVSVTQYQRR